ncbi:MAG: hypothetical protein Q8N63_00330 [Nanoarchaeota archaeon]|nr:hypothetical protein [Nanoarchaeota archaeon]
MGTVTTGAMSLFMINKRFEELTKEVKGVRVIKIRQLEEVLDNLNIFNKEVYFSQKIKFFVKSGWLVVYGKK